MEQVYFSGGGGRGEGGDRMKGLNHIKRRRCKEEEGRVLITFHAI